MDHHLIRENHQRDFCPYCRVKMNGDRWQSEWDNDKHYKTIICRGCKKKIWMPVDFDGDGNDTWDGCEFHTSDSLDVIIRDVEPRIKIV